MTENSSSGHKSFSVIIPALNEEAYLRACLESVVPQLKNGDECIVVDNGSTDMTKQICLEFKKVIYVYEPVQGIAYAQASGFKIAKGDYYVRLDADARAPKGWLKNIRTFWLNNSDSKLVGGVGKAFDTGLPRLGQFFMYHGIYGLHGLLVGHKAVWGTCYSVKPEVWEELGPRMSYHPKSWEDFELAHLAYLAGYTPEFSQNLSVIYSQRSGVVSPRFISTLMYQYRAVYTYYLVGSARGVLGALIDRPLLMLFGSPFVLYLRLRWHLAGRPQP